MDAASALGKIGPASIPALKDLLKDKTYQYRTAPVWALRDIGLPAVPIIVELLKDEDSFCRQEAAAALGQIRPTAKAGIPALIESLRDTVWIIRETAATSLGQMGPESQEGRTGSDGIAQGRSVGSAVYRSRGSGTHEA